MYVASPNETDTGVLNKNMATFERNYPKLLQMIEIGVDLKKVTDSQTNFVTVLLGQALITSYGCHT